MSSDETQASDRDQRLDEVIAAYLRAVETGQEGDPEQWLARYPDLATELSEFFADHQRVERLAGPVRAAISAAPPLGSKVTYVGDYELLEELGRGGMGVVYKARQLSLKRLVALKMILAGEHAGPQELARFRTEAEAVARLQHPHIVQIHEVGEHEGHAYFALEFVDGGSLDRKLAGTPLPARQAAQLVETLARAMQAAHQQGVVHRDLKPANILLQRSEDRSQKAKDRGATGSASDLCPQTSDLVPKITDFGLAKLVGEEAGQTRSGAIMGTPSYMAPEQAEGRSQDIGPAADIYALGAILYELLTGRPPFRADTPLNTILQVVADEPVPPRQLQPRTPRDLETICLKCLQKDRRRRYSSAEALAEDLRHFQEGKPITARPVGPLERAWRWCRRNPVVAGLVAAVAAALLAGTAISWHFAIQARDRAKEAMDRAEQARAESNRADTEARRANGQKEIARRHLYAAQINLAQRAWEDGQVGQVLVLLEQHEPRPGEEDLRDWEWHYQQRLCHGDLRTLQGHGGEVTSVAFSPDGRRLASGSIDRTVKLWDAADGRELRTLQGHPGLITSVAFSPDGRRLASGDWDGTIKVWDTADGQELRSFKGHTAQVWSVVFSPDGQRLAWGCADSTAKVCDLASGHARPLKGHTAWVISVAFSPDGQRLASGSNDGTVKVWDAAAGREVRTLKGHSRQVTSVAFSPDGQRLASGSVDRTVRVWDAISDREVRSLNGHADVVQCVAFSPDGRQLVSGSADQTVKVWDAAGGRELRTLKGHTMVVSSVAFSPDGQHLASASADGAIKVWNAAGGQEPCTLSGHTAEVGCVAFSADGQRLASTSWDGAVKVWDVASGQEQHSFKGRKGSFHGVAFGPDGRRLASVGVDGDVKLRDAITGQELLSLKGHTSEVMTVAFSPDGQRLASASGDGTIKVWDAVAGRELRNINGRSRGVHCLAFSPDGQRLASASEELSVEVWDALSGQELPTPCGGWSVAFSPDGRQLASGNCDGTVKIWEVAGGQEVRTVKGHTGFVYGVAFSPDGRRLASAGEDRTVKVWDVVGGHEVHALKGHSGRVESVTFSPDGQRLASASDDGTVKVWDARPPTPQLSIEREALGLVEFLFSRPLLKEEVIAGIRTNQSISDPVRQQALAFAERFRAETNPQRCADAGRALARQPYLNAFQYQLALSQAKAACRLAPDKAQYRTTLGMAQYRQGQNQEALATLTREDAQMKGSPAALAFLAMTCHRLGQKDQARAYLDRLRDRMKQPAGAKDEEGEALRREAEALIEGK